MFLIVPIRAAAQVDAEATPEVAVSSPTAGQAIRGSFPVVVNLSVEGFASAELSFAYQSAHQETWFPIAQSEQVLSNQVMAEWDTTLITDGIYRLRLLVQLKNGTSITTILEGVRVRNYSPIETETPTPSATAAPVMTPLPTETPLPSATPIPATPTALPQNPLVFTPQDIGVNLFRGVAGGFALIALVGLYLSIRNLFRK